MKDQHTKITGYRDLSQEEIDLMNEIKARGSELGELIAKLRGRNALRTTEQLFPPPEVWETDRWINLGRDHLQQGIMCLVRAVAKPESF